MHERATDARARTWLGLTTSRPSNLAIVASGALATDDLTDGREHRPTDRGGVNPWFLRSHITGDT